MFSRLPRLLIFLAIISVILFPYERVAFCRIRAVRKIAVLCRERKINFKVINRAYPFSTNKRNEFDFIIRIDKTLVPVKLFSATDRKSTIILDSSGRTCIIGRHREPLSRDGNKKITTTKAYSKLPNMKISKKIVGERYGCFPVFLNEPSFDKVLFRDASGKVSNFYDGAYEVAGCNFVDREVLADLIEVYKGK